MNAREIIMLRESLREHQKAVCEEIRRALGAIGLGVSHLTPDDNLGFELRAYVIDPQVPVARATGEDTAPSIASQSAHTRR